ncbi:hypothetical protein [Flavobacterium sp. ZB4P13]|uniref:hypothetical protein n=1 Tax=Flavobacterium sp. ZB4P13 TaxID=3401728 RepID=UPI003AAA29AC
MKYTLLFLYTLIFINTDAQTIWKSPKYGYSIEIPKGFTKSTSVGINVDFKANNGIASIVIVVISLPKEVNKLTIWEILGELKGFGSSWEDGAKEYMKKPKFIKSGKTLLNNLPAFWYDYTSEEPKLYSKTYQLKKGNLLYTITLTCLYNDSNFYSPVWYRFKEKIKI